MKFTYFKVGMPLGIIEDYYNSHFANNLRIDHDNISNPQIVYLESKAKEIFSEGKENKVNTIFFDMEGTKKIRHDYPDKYQHYLTLYACISIYNDCLRIRSIQDEIEKLRSSLNVSNFAEDGKNAERLGLEGELNTIRKKFFGMDHWGVNEDFKDIYKKYKYAILEQCDKCMMDVDIQKESMPESSGCLFHIFILLILIYTFIT